MHANHRFSLCKSAQFQKITFGAPAVNAEMGQPRIDRGVSANEPAIPVQNAHEPDPDVEMHVNGDLPDLEIEAEDNEEAPTPIAVWQELVEQDGPIGVTEDLMAKTRICRNSDDFGDESRRVPVDLEAVNPAQDARSLYEDIRIQLVHDFIINNKLSTDAGDQLLDLWTQVNRVIVAWLLELTSNFRLHKLN
jgi:hypothetical protein